MRITGKEGDGVPQTPTLPTKRKRGKSRCRAGAAPHFLSLAFCSLGHPGYPHSHQAGTPLLPDPAWKKVTLQITAPICWRVGELQTGQGPKPQYLLYETSPRRLPVTRANSPGAAQPARHPGPLALVSAPHVQRWPGPSAQPRLQVL